MVRGADAADVAMITAFGDYQLKYFRVWADQLADGLGDVVILDMQQTRPGGEPLIFLTSARVA